MSFPAYVIAHPSCRSDFSLFLVFGFRFRYFVFAILKSPFRNNVFCFIVFLSVSVENDDLFTMKFMLALPITLSYMLSSLHVILFRNKIEPNE